MSKIDEERFRALTEDPATWPLIDEARSEHNAFKRQLQSWQRGLVAAYWTVMTLILGFNVWLVYLIWF